MRTMLHLGETLPDAMTSSYHISAGLLFLWATLLFALMLATFGIGAASGMADDTYLCSNSPSFVIPGECDILAFTITDPRVQWDEQSDLTLLWSQQIRGFV